MNGAHITDAGAYCWCGPRVEENGTLIIHRDAPEIAAEAKALRAKLDALRNAVRCVSADPEVPMTDTVAEAVVIASGDVVVDHEQIERMWRNVRRHLDGEGGA